MEKKVLHFQEDTPQFSDILPALAFYFIQKVLGLKYLKNNEQPSWIGIFIKMKAKKRPNTI